MDPLPLFLLVLTSEGNVGTATASAPSTTHSLIVTIILYNLIPSPLLSA